MAVGSQIAISNILADLNLAVRYRITICIYVSKKILADFNLAVALAVHQTAKFNFPPNFPVIWYYTLLVCAASLYYYTVSAVIGSAPELSNPKKQKMKFYAVILFPHCSWLTSLPGTLMLDQRPEAIDRPLKLSRETFSGWPTAKIFKLVLITLKPVLILNCGEYPQK